MIDISIPTIALRELEPEDIPHLYRYRNDPDVTRGLGGFSPGYSLQAIKDWIERHAAVPDEHIWAIADRETNTCLGHVGLYQIDHRVRSCELGIIIGDLSKWGKGIGREVTRAIIAYAFDELNMNRIELSVVSSNARALHLYEGLGFAREGVRRQAQYRAGAYLDVVVMAMLRAENQK